MGTEGGIKLRLLNYKFRSEYWKYPEYWGYKVIKLIWYLWYNPVVGCMMCVV